MRSPSIVAAIASLFSLASPFAYAQVFTTTAAERPEQASASTPVAQSAQAQPGKGDGKSPDDWRFAATLYAWAVNLNGSATTHGNTVDINASIIDIIQKSSSLIGFMGDFEANKGRFGFYADLVWAQLGIPKSAASYRNPIPACNDDELTRHLWMSIGVHGVLRRCISVERAVRPERL